MQNYSVLLTPCLQRTYIYILCGVLQQPRTYIYVLRQMKSPKVWSLRKELWSLRKVAGCWMYLVLVGKGLKLTACLDMVHPRRPRGGQSGWEKWCTKSFQASGYPLSLDHFQMLKRTLAPDWAQKCFVLLCPIGKQHLLGLWGWILFIIHL